MNKSLYNVCGYEDVDQLFFARCTTYEKAEKAKKLLEKEGFIDCLEILQDEIPIDIIEIEGKQIYL